MKKIIFITQRAGFPNGFGATNIITNYSKGFINLGYDVDLLLLRPSEIDRKNPKNCLSKGVFEGINYKYLSCSVYSSKKRLIRVVKYVFASIHLIFYFMFNNKKIFKVFFYSPETIVNSKISTILCKIYRIPIVGIKTESSISDISKKRIKNLNIYELNVYKHFNKMIVISSHLKTQLIDFGYTNRIDVIPIIIDDNVIENHDYSSREKTIVYVGGLSNNNDLTNIFKIFTQFSIKNTSWTLNIIGDFNSENDKTIFLKSINSNNILNRVKFLGFKTKIEINQLLGCSGIAILPRSKNESSIAGFPIKLADYLISGVPIIVSKIGDLTLYLRDVIDVIYCEADNMDDFVEKLLLVTNNYENYKNMAFSGKNRAIELFGSKNICMRMLLDE